MFVPMHSTGENKHLFHLQTHFKLAMQCNLKTQRFPLHPYFDIFYEIIIFTEQCIFNFLLWSAPGLYLMFNVCLKYVYVCTSIYR